MDDRQVISSQMSRFIEKIGEIRKQEQLCDFTIRVGHKQLKTHKLVLAANSDYFRAMFSHNSIELEKGQVILQNIEPNAVAAIVDFCYTCKIDLNNENIQDICVAASILQVPIIQDICIKFIEERIDPTNCLGVAVLAERCNLMHLQEKAFYYSLEHFKLVIEEKEFPTLDDSMLSRILAEDKLNIEDETQVFQSVIKWIKQDLDQREEKVYKLMRHVRFALIDPVTLVSLTSIDLIQKSAGCRRLIDSAKNYLLLKDYPQKQEELVGQLNVKPRDSFKRRQRIYAVGGWTDEFKSIASAEVYDPSGDFWYEIPPMTQRRCGVGLTTLHDSIYAIGGHDGMNFLNSVERFDVVSQKWFKDVAKMKYVRTSVGVVSLDGCIYAIGGQTSSGATDKMEEYAPKTNTWTDCCPMKQKRLGAGVAVLNGYIYVMGGSESGSIYDSVERYDPKTNSWVYVCSMQVARKHLGSCTCHGFIYAVGGRNGYGELDSAEVYDSTSDTWTKIQPMHMKRSGIGLVELAGILYAIGGQNQDARLNEVEAYDPSTQEWKWKAPMKHGRLGGGMTIHPVVEF